MGSFETENVAEAYLALLRRRGVERLYVNAGTDFPPLVEAYARAEDSKLDLPEPVIAMHENLAVGMAHGAYLVTHRPQAVMLHVSVGTANAICAIINAARDRIPIILTAGRSPIYEEGRLGARDMPIHWAQEMFDQAGMLREMVKWDYELRGGQQVAEVVDRAVAVALSEPRGPVYPSLPREALAEPLEQLDFREEGTAVPSPPHPAPEAVEDLADLLAGARHPVIVTSVSGADEVTVALLGELCDRYGIGVVDSRPRYVNVPADHPLHLGYRAEAVLAEADVACFLECDVPWISKLGTPREDAVVVQCGPDPLFAGYPMRSHRADLAITATSRSLLTHLGPALEQRVGTIDPGRRDRLAEAAAARRQVADRAAANDDQQGGPITKAFMNRTLARVRPEDSVVVNEYWVDASLLGATQPGTYFGLSPAGGLGWGLPAALGIKQAAPERTVIAALGDGSYMFANPAACHQAGAMYDLPVLTIVCNNSKWGAVEGATHLVYPDGHAVENHSFPLSTLEPMAALERYVEASGGHGEAVERREDLAPAIERGLRVVREEGRQAVLNVICA